MRFTKHISLQFVALVAALLLVLVPTTVFAAASCVDGNSAACLNESESSKQVLGIIVLLINLLAAGVGVLSVIMLVSAGIQYSASADNPQAVQAAKQRIYNVIIGLVTFFLLYGFLQWLIPGGVGI